MFSVQESDWLNRLNNAVEFIERNLLNDIAAKDVAEVACSSTFHFQRIFHLLAGCTVGQYVRNRRLWLAACGLREGRPVGEVAVEHGYASPEAFSRAFRKHFGFTPSQVRRGQFVTEPFERITFISSRGVENMKYKILKKRAFSLIGPEIQTSIEDNAQNATIASFWANLMSSGEFAQVSSFSHPDVLERGTVVGACISSPEGGGSFTYKIAVEYSRASHPAYPVRDIPAVIWAVFEAAGDPSQSVPRVFKQAYGEFFSKEPYRLNPSLPELEVYPDTPIGPNYVCEVWFPLLPEDGQPSAE